MQPSLLSYDLGLHSLLWGSGLFNLEVWTNLRNVLSNSAS